MRRLVVILTALVLIGGACGEDNADGPGGAEASGSTYETVTDMNADLAGAGIDCDLEYEGLKDADREISQCVIDGDQAVLNVWFNDDLRQAIIDESGDTAAFGANWTVQVGSPETATAVAEALGGSIGGAAS